MKPLKIHSIGTTIIFEGLELTEDKEPFNYGELTTNKPMKQQIVLVIPFNTIGVIIEEGTNPNGSKWYRTDSDGIREEWELAFFKDIEAANQCILCLRSKVAPSTKALITMKP